MYTIGENVIKKLVRLEEMEAAGMPISRVSLHELTRTYNIDHIAEQLHINPRTLAVYRSGERTMPIDFLAQLMFSHPTLDVRGTIARIVRARVKKGQSKISEEWLSEHPEFMEDDKWISR